MAIILAKADVRSIWETFLAVIGLFGGTISGLFLLGILTQRAHGTGALLGATASATLVGFVYWQQLTVFWLFPVIGVTSCFTLGYLLSLLITNQKREESRV
jgi:SSS family solute:Na+ symporter